jgi:hypothetical protein
MYLEGILYPSISLFEKTLKRGGIFKLSTKTVKLKSKTLGFIEIEDNHQNVGWEFAKRNNKGENSNFLLN